MFKRYALLCAAVLTSCLVTGSAAALVCGEVIYTDTVMTHDLLNCPSPGLVIGEDGVTLEMAGHLISGRGSGTGISVLGGVSHVRIQGPGKVEGFHLGVEARGSHHVTVQKLTLLGNLGAGISFYEVEDSLVYGNEVIASTYGISREGAGGPASRNRVQENQVNNCMGYGAGLILHAGDDHAVESNFIDGCDGGMALSGTSRVLIEGNAILRTNQAISLVSGWVGPMDENRIVRNKIYQNASNIQISSGIAATYPIKQTLIEENAFEGGLYGLYLDDALVALTNFLDNHLDLVTTPLVDNGTGTVSSGNFCNGVPCP